MGQPLPSEAQGLAHAAGKRPTVHDLLVQVLREWPCRQGEHGTDSYEDAKTILKRREGAAASGAPGVPRIDGIRYDEAAEDLRTHYKTAREDHIVPKWAKVARRSLDGMFTGYRLVAITPTVISEHVHRRQAEGAANGTVNRELASWDGCSGSPTSTGSSRGCR